MPEPIKPGQVASPYVRPCIEAARRIGIADRALANAVNRPESWLYNPPDAINTLDYLSLMACGARRDATFGLRVGRSVTPGSFPVLGYTIMNCRDLGQVIGEVIEFESLNHDLGYSHLVTEGGVARVEWHPNPAYLPDPHSEIYRHVVDSVLAGFVTFAPWVLAQMPMVRCVELAYPRPLEAIPHEQALGAPVAFERERNGITVDRSVLRWRVATNDPMLSDTLYEHAASLLAFQQTESHFRTTDHLRRQLIKALPRCELSLTIIARRLNMSPRALQRHLAREETTFQNEVDRMRRALARSYLEQATLTLGQTALALGFREQSSFNHWFRGVEGMSPGQYRYWCNRNKERKGG